MVNEIWKDIDGYNGVYQISDMGRIKSHKYGRTIIMCPSSTLKGYKRIKLTVENKSTSFSVHRLVLNAFNPNVYNKSTVNHKNGISNDNRLDNLEWATMSENVKHSFDILNRTPSSRAKISQFNLNDELIKNWDSIADAIRFTGLSRSSISQCCTNHRKTCGGYKWKYTK